MIASNAIMPTSGKGDPNCFTSQTRAAVTIEANKSNSGEETGGGDIAASNAANNISSCSQVSSDNENSSSHSTTWSTSSKRGAQKRLEAAQKLNLILPQQQLLQQQQQQPQHHQLHLQQKNCLSTPIVITSDDLHPVPSQQQSLGYPSQQQMLFDSLAHQLNAQGAEVSLFTGLPSCTPTSADRLTSINPFFLHAANANTTTSNQNENHLNEPAQNGADRMDRMRSSWLEQNGVAAAAAAAAAAHTLDQDQSTMSKQGLVVATTMANGYNANNYSLQLNNNNNTNNQLIDHQRATLTIADLHAANAALSPIILSPALSFLGLSPEQEALLRYGGYVSPQQHPLAGRGFSQSDLNQLNHHHQVYHLNQIYQSQRVEPIRTHHFNAHHQQQQQQQINHHHQGFHHQHPPPPPPQQQQQQQAYDRDQQQQRQNQKDLIQQTPASLTATAPSTTGQIRNQNPHLYQNRLSLGQQLVQQQQHLQSPHINQIHQPNDGSHGPIDHARAQQQRPFGSIAGTSNQLQSTTGLIDREALPEAAPTDAFGQQVGTTVEARARSLQSTPVLRGEQPVGRQQLVTTSIREPHSRPQQSGLLLISASTNGACNGLAPIPTTSGPNSFLVDQRVACPIRPAIILHEPTQSSGPVNSSDSMSPTYRNPELDQTREAPVKVPKLNDCQSAPLRDGSAVLSPRANSVASTETSRIATNTTNIITCNNLSRSPTGRLTTSKEAGQRPNSSDNLVNSDQALALGSDGDPAAKSSSISSSDQHGVRMKAKKRLLKRGATASEQDHQQTSIQRDQDGNELPVKKKSRGGRKKKLVTHEEMLARKNRSKERNRVAARRCRQKRKQFLDELRDKIDHLHELNQGLRKENAMLKNELEAIKRQQNVDGLS